METIAYEKRSSDFEQLVTAAPSELTFYDLHAKNRLNRDKYNITAWFYDILDLPWELQYRKWRPDLVGDVRGEVLEAGVGTGRNLKYYHHDVNLTALDFSSTMLKHAMKREKDASCNINFVQDDACYMTSVPSGRFDWTVATFLLCVIPEENQKQVTNQFVRTLKPGGRFRILEMVYSKNPSLKKKQDFFAPFVEKVYGARFDRNTLKHVEDTDNLEITGTHFLKDDTYLLIEGMRKY
jgi:demethylmenaquinone methyltransferase/2-methoxy-6-polyprenyl-1,4-benzoquinol methylase